MADPKRPAPQRAQDAPGARRRPARPPPRPRQADVRPAVRRARHGRPAPGRNPHQLRHSWASHALAAGYGIGDVARYLGDSPATVARVYAHPTGADPSAWVDAAVSPPARPRRR